MAQLAVQGELREKPGDIAFLLATYGESVISISFLDSAPSAGVRWK